MVRSKNYDSPFDKEELDNLERQSLLDEEQLQNTEFADDFMSSPNLSYSIHALPWLAQNPTPFFSDDESDAYERYKEIEGLK